MRAEVILITRNVKIFTEDKEKEGCTILTTDTLQGDGSTNVVGTLNLNSAEIFNCSQYNSGKNDVAALRFESALS